MRKLFLVIATISIAVSCIKSEDMVSVENFTLTGYFDEEARSSFGTPNATSIPYFWSKGDHIWLGSTKSDAIAESTKIAIFEFSNGSPAGIGAAHVFYNITGNSEYAKVPATQSAANDLGKNGAFGYAKADKYGSFVLKYKTAYFWFDTKSNDITTPLTSITLTAGEGLALSGECEFDFVSGAWLTSVANASNQVVLEFGEGVALQSSNSGVFASMVVLPAAIGGKQLTIVYTFADGSTFTEVKTPSKSLEMGATRRISTTISAANLVKPEPELPYELRVLTFEDKDAKFEPYYLDYVNNYEGKEIKKWSDLIDSPQYMGPLTYGNNQQDAMYTWWDEGNTELMHTFPDNYAYCFWGGGHAISNYWGEGYTDEDRNKHIAKYYGQDYVDQWAGKPGADGALGWFNVQMMVPVAPHSGENFVVHYGYKDFFNYIENLPEIVFADEVARVIDHMWVTNTNYTLNQLVNGVKSEDGNTFGGSWEGLNDDAWLKIVAYGFDDAYADAYAEPISQVEFYLVQGTNVVTDWQKWDLSGLGAVKKVRFNFLYSDDMGGKYGFTIPGYFAYDDIAVRFEK